MSCSAKANVMSRNSSTLRASSIVFFIAPLAEAVVFAVVVLGLGLFLADFFEVFFLSVAVVATGFFAFIAVDAAGGFAARPRSTPAIATGIQHRKSWRL